ncbi:MAG: hypothetical protein A2231_09570 [Candidatus Firestonebacteria bacterium RIFOXYA2_FULL_40_8]|nr:MAG: hypothetical protein A2231_09570 [Candidatus Firestonebacteria bacterium RIFOXYA2_FULL_40_8]
MQEFIKWLLDLDVRVFYFLNRDLANPVLDFVMPIITDEKFILIPVIAAAIYFMIKGSRKTRISLLCMIIAVLLADAVAYRIIKPFFGRLRPCDVLPNVHILSGAGRFSFPSNHAANMMALAVITAFFYKKYAWIIFVIALIEGFSRVYVGVHYPLDVLNGYIFGALCAFLVIAVYRGIEFEKKKKGAKK